MNTVCSYCQFYGSVVVNPTPLHLNSHPLNAVAVPA